MKGQELLMVVEGAWRQLDAAIAGLDDAAMAEPGVVGPWSVNDLLGHVTAWEQTALRHLDEWQRGAALTSTGGSSVDTYNAAEAEMRHAWSVAEIRAEMAQAREQLRAALGQLDDAAWATPVHAGEWQGTVGEMLGGDLSGPMGPGMHAAEHAEQTRTWRRRQQAAGG